MSQREDLLAAARNLLTEKGYHRTTARDVASAAGSHLASIGYHFGSKDALMTLAALELQTEWGRAIDAAVAAAGSVSPSERLRICVDVLIDAITRQPEVVVASVQVYAQAAFDEDIRRALEDGTASARRSLAAGMLGVPVERVDEDTARGIGSLVHAMVAGLTLQALVDPSTLPTGAQLAEALRTLARKRPR